MCIMSPLFFCMLPPLSAVALHCAIPHNDSLQRAFFMEHMSVSIRPTAICVTQITYWLIDSKKWPAVPRPDLFQFDIALSSAVCKSGTRLLPIVFSYMLVTYYWLLHVLFTVCWGFNVLYFPYPSYLTPVHDIIQKLSRGLGEQAICAGVSISIHVFMDLQDPGQD